MNLIINKLQTASVSKKLQTNKNSKFNIEIDDEKISNEQDKIDYEVYKKSIMLHTAFTYEEFKNNNSSFPPHNAPGIIRKEWRELFKGATEKEKWDIIAFGFDCMDVLNKENINMPTNFNGYLKFAGKMKDYIEKYRNCPGIDPKFYERMKTIATNFEGALKRYIE